MASSLSSAEFIVWVDQTAYGPVELPALVSWIRDERVQADTWVFVGRNGAWVQASELPELQMFFGKRATSSAAAGDSATSIRGTDPRALRQIKVLAQMTEDQLERFAKYLEIERVPQWTVIVRQGDPGDTMCFILEGELRVRLMVMEQETILSTLGPGDFFGDISLFDCGPRAADVVANSDACIARLSARSFDQLSREMPELATPFLRAIGRTLTARIRADNKRYGDSVKFSRSAA